MYGVSGLQEYVHAYMRWLLNDSVAKQFDAFARGFNNVAAGPALDMFRAEELALLVTGSENLDMKALESAAAYEEPYSANHPVIKQFWYVVFARAAVLIGGISLRLLPLGDDASGRMTAVWGMQVGRSLFHAGREAQIFSFCVWLRPCTHSWPQRFACCHPACRS